MWNRGETQTPKGAGGVTTEAKEERNGNGQQPPGKAALWIPKWDTANHGGTWGNGDTVWFNVRLCLIVQLCYYACDSLSVILSI